MLGLIVRIALWLGLSVGATAVIALATIRSWSPIAVATVVVLFVISAVLLVVAVRDAVVRRRRSVDRP